MRDARIALLPIMMLALPFSAAPAAAGTGVTGVEVTPFGGYQVGGTLDFHEPSGGRTVADVRGSGDFGLCVDLLLGPDGAVGLFYSRQNTELDTDPVAGSGDAPMRIEYYQVEGFYQLGDGPVRPFVAASVGVTHLVPEGFDADSRLSASVGGGVRLFPAAHVGFRLEGRYYGTLIDWGGGDLCTHDGELCARSRDNTYMDQVDFKAGLVVAF